MRRTRLLHRAAGAKDIRIFLVAVEGERREKRYFDGLAPNGVIDRDRTHIEVLAPESSEDGAGSGLSSPEHVAERLRQAEASIALEAFDHRWLVLDVDRWEEGTLAQVCREAVQRGWRTGISNPCFEVWLLLHFAKEPVLVSPKQALHELRDRHAPGEDWPWTRERIRAAIERAKTLDGAPDRRWPDAPGTYVYRLAAALLSD